MGHLFHNTRYKSMGSKQEILGHRWTEATEAFVKGTTQQVGFNRDLPVHNSVKNVLATFS